MSEPRPVGTLPSLEMVLETILFVADGPVEIGRVQRALEIDRAEAEAAIGRLAEQYRGRGVRLQRRGETLQLVSAPEAAEYVERFLGLSERGRLSAAALETLAREARPVSLAPGTVIVQEGEPGAEFYAIRAGEVAVDRAGERIAVRTVGDGFGELALLFDVPRTATVTAITPVELLAIGRDAFLVAVTGEQATVHSVATHIETFEHALGTWRPKPDAELDSDA